MEPWSVCGLFLYLPLLADKELYLDLAHPGNVCPEEACRGGHCGGDNTRGNAHPEISGHLIILPIIYWETIIFICKLGLRSRTYEKLASFVVHIYGADSLFWILEFPFESNFSKCTTPSSAPLFPQCTAKQSLVTLSTKNHLNVILQLSCQKRLPGFGLTSYFFLPCCALWVDRPCCLTLAPLLAAAVQLTSGLDMCPGPHLRMRQTSSWRKPRLSIRLRLTSCSTSAA